MAHGFRLFTPGRQHLGEWRRKWESLGRCLDGGRRLLINGSEVTVWRNRPVRVGSLRIDPPFPPFGPCRSPITSEQVEGSPMREGPGIGFLDLTCHRRRSVPSQLA